MTYDNDGRFPDGAAVQARYPDTGAGPTRAESSLPVTTCLPVESAEPSPVLGREAGRVGLTAPQMELCLQRGGYFRSR